MRILVDENVPAPVVGMLRTLLPGHEVQSVRDIKWTGRDDAALLAAASDKGFDAFLTRDNRQLDDASEQATIRRSGMHHIRYRQDGRGRAGLGLAMGAVIAAMTRVADELAQAGGQRLIQIKGQTSDNAPYETVDPTRQSPKPPAPPPRTPSVRRKTSGAPGREPAALPSASSVRRKTAAAPKGTPSGRRKAGAAPPGPATMSSPRRPDR